MARAKRNIKKQAKPEKYLAIVEGCTEENYLKHLKNLGTHALGSILNCKGGKARSVLLEAIKKYEKYGQYYKGYLIWFDADEYQQADHTLHERLEKTGVMDIFISSPCIEHWLLAHFETINLYANQNCKQCETRLKKHIPHYKKNDCTLLERHISIEHINMAKQHYAELANIPAKYFQL